MEGNYRLVALRRRQPVTCAITSPTLLAVGTGVPRASVGSHITPTKRRKVVKGAVTSYSEQGRCKECHKKTTNCCSVCVDAMEEDPDNPLKSAWICSAKKGKMCFANHLRRCHGI